MILLLALLFLFRQYGTSAAPVTASFAEPPAYNATLFIRDDCTDANPGRSVWDIVWSCLATTFAVTWVSVHPNVPFLEESSWHLLKRRIFLMCLALLAPEVMIMWAFKQWRGAVMIRKIINEARPKSSSMQWTMLHAHFLQMGGFKMNRPQDQRLCSVSGGKCKNATLHNRYTTVKKGIKVQEVVISFADFREILSKQLIDFPDTTAKEIEDRSKSDALSKGVALLQISWFLLQLIARAHQQLAITEIELTTAALAGLNSIMYLFWWNKPFDVRCPIIICTRKLERRFVEVGRERVERKYGGHGHICGSIERQDTEGDVNTGKAEMKTGQQETTLLTGPEGGEDGNEQTVADDKKGKGVQISVSTNLVGKAGNGGNIGQENWSFPMNQYGFPLPVSFDLTLYLMATSSECLGRASNTVRTVLDWVFLNFVFFAFWLYSAIRTALDHDDSDEKSAVRRFLKSIWTCCKSASTKLLYMPYLLMFLPVYAIFDPVRGPSLDCFGEPKKYMDNLSSLQLLFDKGNMAWIMSMMFYSEEVDTKPLLMLSALAGAAFGSIHCAAWNFEFPSSAEQILWRTASLTIVGVCLCIIVGTPLYTFVEEKWWRSILGPRARFHMLLEISKVTMETAPSIVYPIARVSLLILSLLSLRDLPPSALQTVTWTKFIPHI